VIEATSDEDGQAVVLSDPSLEGILLDWTLSDDDVATIKPGAAGAHPPAQHTHPDLPDAERDDASTLTGEVMRAADELNLDAGRYFVLHCRACGCRHPALPGSHRASVDQGSDRLCPGV